MGKCSLCDERKEEIDRILKSYKRDKKIALITIAILAGELFLTLASGKDGFMTGIDILKGIFTK